MLLIHRKETDPYFNIAAEEYLLKNFREDILTVWINDPCIVVGKHQNTLSEINYRFVREYNVPVLRRITGGGTVYQDQGNLNFSFISSGKQGRLVDYRRSTKPVVDFLQTLGVRADFEGKSNLVINGGKFSGNSAHVYKNRVIHHGTILYDSDLEKLKLSLMPGSAVYTDKSVQSARARVTNISDHLAEKVPISEFAAMFTGFVMNNNPHNSIYILTGEDRNEIEKLADGKYRTWEWTFGYSPDYRLENDVESQGHRWKVMLEASKGMIREIRVSKEDGTKMEELEKNLHGLPHREDIIRKTLGNINFAEHHPNFNTEEFINKIF